MASISYEAREQHHLFLDAESKAPIEEPEHAWDVGVTVILLLFFWGGGGGDEDQLLVSLDMGGMRGPSASFGVSIRCFQ